MDAYSHVSLANCVAEKDFCKPQRPVDLFSAAYLTEWNYWTCLLPPLRCLMEIVSDLEREKKVKDLSRECCRMDPAHKTQSLRPFKVIRDKHVPSSLMLSLRLRGNYAQHPIKRGVKRKASCSDSHQITSRQSTGTVKTLILMVTVRTSYD